MRSISDRLKSQNVNVGTPRVQPVEPVHPAPIRSSRGRHVIESVLAGYDEITPLGSAFVVRRDFPMDYRHGVVDLCTRENVDILGQWCKLDRLADKDLGKYVFLDTETSGLAGGTGTYAFLIGLGFHTPEGFRLLQLFMREPGEEAALLAALARIIDPFEVVVTFNGKSFDIPLLNTRHVINKIPTPFEEMAHVDLLPLARRIWKNRLPSRALKSLEVDILSLPRTDDEVPGELIPELYFNYLRSGDARPLAGVFYHNGMDIVSLAALFNYTSKMLSNPFGNVPEGLDLVAIARLYEELGHLETALQLYEKCLEFDLPRPFFVQTMMRFAQLHRKNGRIQEAVNLWVKALEYDVYEAGIELAKYFEHQLRDFSQAIHFTEMTITCVQRADIPRYQRKILLGDIQHRMERLNRLAAKKSGR